MTGLLFLTSIYCLYNLWEESLESCESAEPCSSASLMSIRKTQLFSGLHQPVNSPFWVVVWADSKRMLSSRHLIDSLIRDQWFTYGSILIYQKLSLYSLQTHRNHNIALKFILITYFNWITITQLLFNSPMCNDSYDYCHGIRRFQPITNWLLHIYTLYLKPHSRLSFAYLCSFARWVFHFIFLCVFPFGVRDIFQWTK